MKYGEMFSSDDIIRLGKLLQDITTDLRNFESKFSTKIELIYNFYTNHWVIEHNLNTTRYMLDLFDTNDKKFFANVQATSESEIVINLTEAMTGRANVIFIV